MGKTGKTFWKKIFGTGNIFRKTFAGLLLLSAAMIFSAILIYNSVEGKSHREQVAVINLERLRQSSDFLTTYIENLSQNMNQMLWNTDTVGFLVTPNADTDTEVRERRYRILSSLENTVSGNAMVRHAFLYSPFQDLILSSDQFAGKAENYRDFDQLEDFLSSSSDAPGLQVLPVHLRVQDGRLFLYCDLTISTRVGTLVYELDSDLLADRMGLNGDGESGQILVYNEEKNPVFEGISDYGDAAPDWGNEALFVTSGDRTAEQSRTRGFYRYDSATGWIFLTALDTRRLIPDFRNAFIVWLPSVIVFLALSLFFAYYISRSVYDPVNRLMNLVMQTGDNRKNEIGDGEIDYLEDAYTDAMDQKERVRGIVGVITPEVTSSLLQELISGRQRTEKEIENILQGLGNPVPMTGRFLVIAIGMEEGADGEITESETALFLVYIHNLTEEIRQKYRSVISARVGACQACLVICFPEEMSAVDLKKEYGEVIRSLKSRSGKLPHAIRAERGSICRNLMDVGSSYREALQKIQYHAYLDEDSSNEEEEDLISINFVRQQTRSILEKLASGSEAEADALAVRFLNGLEVSEKSGESEELFRRFIDDITEKAVSLPLDEDDLSEVENLSKTPVRNPAETLAVYRKLARLIARYSGQNRVRYIEKAKEYIAEKYSDSSLSLSDLGAVTGISPSYLSELFKETCGENFSAYLQDYRVDKAAQLLRTTNVTAKEIGFMCGFNSVQNFNRVFKKCRGVTPGAYRASAKNGDE